MNRVLFFLLILISRDVIATTFTVQLKKPNHHVLLRNGDEIIEFRPNSSIHWGTKISSDKFYFQYGQKLKNTNYSGHSVGNDSYKDYRLGLSIKNTFTEINYKEWIGFSSNESDEHLSNEAEASGADLQCDYCLDRSRLSSRERSLSFLYAFNEKFQMKALNSNGSEGVEFSHTWLGAVFANRFKLFDPGGIFQGENEGGFSLFENSSSFELRQVGVAGGYGLLFPYKFLYGGIAGLLGAGYQENIRVSLDNQRRLQNGVGLRVSLKLMLATHGKGMNYGLKGYFFSNVFEVGAHETIASLNYSLYLYSSYTF